ncbi:MAG: FecR domain-containing protein [Bacteroidales bacterium]
MKEKYDETEHKEILGHYINDAYTRDEAMQVLKLAKGKSNESLFREMADSVWDESEMVMSPTRMEHERLREEGGRLLASLKENKKQNIFSTYWRVAAVILLMITVGISGTNIYSYWERQNMSFVEITTSVGEKKGIQLPDGTHVDMNACSKLRYPKRFVGTERLVELTGEAYFQVERNPEKTFVVKAKGFDVRVLGTKFDVKAYPSDELVSVSVENGKVQVDMPEAMMRLKANEQLVINRKSQEYNKRRSMLQVNSWIKGELSFNATPIRDVAKELERIYGCNIKFAEGLDFNNLISGAHDNESLESVLNTLVYISDIKYRQEQDFILFYK